MEEADICCQRIGIMSKGSLKCIAAQSRLKQLYGTGYKLSFTCRSKSWRKVSASFIERMLPQGWKVLDHFASMRTYEFAADAGIVADLFENILNGHESNGINDWYFFYTTFKKSCTEFQSKEYKPNNS
jgi:hypothetical protein